jgi:glutaminyl-peptide cyclotransferase
VKRTLKGSAGLLVAAAALGLIACKPNPPERSEPVEPGEAAQAKPEFKGGASKLLPDRSAMPAKPVLADLWKEFSGEKAFAQVRKQVEFGPRPSGSAEIEKARVAIAESLGAAGWDVERQEFTEETPRGAVKFVNLVARFSPAMARPAPSSTQRAIVCSHYDTKRFSTIQFTGANDGASSSGALLELARVLALDPQLAAKVELVFFDGEEAVVQFTESDGLYGSRFYARSLRASQRASQFQFGILWDMIGDKDLTITLPPDSPQPLTQNLLGAAEKLGLRGHFAYHDRSIWDDHVPLNQIRIPTVDLIDFDYMPWHTADDTLHQISPESLRAVGAVTLYYLKAALAN